MIGVLPGTLDLDLIATKTVWADGQIMVYSADQMNMEEEQVTLGRFQMDLAIKECYADAEPITPETTVRCREQLPILNAEQASVLRDVVFVDLQCPTAYQVAKIFDGLRLSVFSLKTGNNIKKTIIKF